MAATIRLASLLCFSSSLTGALPPEVPYSSQHPREAGRMPCDSLGD